MTALDIACSVCTWLIWRIIDPGSWTSTSPFEEKILLLLELLSWEILLFSLLCASLLEEDLLDIFFEEGFNFIARPIIEIIICKHFNISSWVCIQSIKEPFSVFILTGAGESIFNCFWKSVSIAHISTFGSFSKVSFIVTGNLSFAISDNVLCKSDTNCW